MVKVLTDKEIRNLKPEKVKGVLKSYEKRDGGARGLYVYVGTSGEKSFVVRYRLNGKPQKLTLGKYIPPEALKDGKEPADPKVGDPLTLAAARRLAPEAWLQAGRGADPVAAKRRDKAEKRQAAANTFEAIALEYLKRECGMKVDAEGEATFDRSKKRSGADRYRTLKSHVFPTLGDRPITEIKKSEIVELLDRLADGELKDDKREIIKGGPVAADRCLALVRKILNWHASRADDYRPPLLKGLNRVKASDNARDRDLKDDELRVIWRVASESEGPFPALVKFLLLTAARRAEAALMKWEEVKGGDWTLPRERNKVAARNKKVKELVRPLSESALAVLKARPRVDGCEYIFSTDGKHALTGYSKPKKKFDEAVLAKLREKDPKAKAFPNWTLHDLRRTARTLLTRAGVKPHHAERCLGHVLPGVEGIYDQHTYHAEMKAAYAALAELIEKITNPPAAPTDQESAHNVLLFPQAREAV